MNKDAITLDNVSYNISSSPIIERPGSDRPILDKVNLEIARSDFIGVIGPNGGGKTTLLKLICGLLKPTRGSVNIFGKSPKESRSLIGYVPQSSKVDRNFPITLEQLVLLGTISKASFFGKYSKEAKEKALYLLNEMDIYHLKDRPFGHLSGGEAQRALIARALINNPDILILDEPTANIDVAAEHKIFNLILKNKGTKTIIMVSHDLEIIIEYVKNIVFVKHSVTTTLPEKICEHFALGLYHKPYLKK